MVRANRTKSKRAPAQRRPRGDRLSPVVENYLLALYLLQEEGKRAALGQLADFLKRFPVSEGLGTSLPSVAGVLRRMVREGMVIVDQSKEIRLTDRGQLLAADMVRRHRLAERMVVDMLGVELHRAHLEAHRLEHAISPELQANIVAKLGNPKTCPFGRPIPGSGYLPDLKEMLTLDKARAGVVYIVDRVPEEDQELLRFLVAHHVLPGTRVAVDEAAAYRGVITVRINDTPIALGYQVAALILVRPAK